jgi:hypothetical protein
MNKDWNHHLANSLSGPPTAADQPPPWEIFIEDLGIDENLADCPPPLPPHHRPLFSGERVRRGDRFVRTGMTHWECVSANHVGTIVQTPDEYDSAHYCRQIHPCSRYWYVDSLLGRGRPDARGSATDPFDSVENARRAIYQFAQQAGEGPFGMVWDIRGQPLEAYDLPEPPGETSPRRAARPMNEAKYTAAAPGRVAGMVPVPPSPTWIDEPIAQSIEPTVDEAVSPEHTPPSLQGETLVECTSPVPPRHRPLFAGETVRRRDKVFCKRMQSWQTVGAELLGTIIAAPSDAARRFCRPTHPRSQTWYVDLRPGRGRRDAVGSFVDPFDSLESARKAIEAAAEELGEGPFGMIWEVRGVPLEAYDLAPITDGVATRRSPAEEQGMAPVPPNGPLTGFPFGIPQRHWRRR